MLALAKPVGTPEDQCEASFHGPESRRHSVLCCEWMLKAPRHKIAKRRYMPIRNIRTGYSTRRLGELLEAHQGRSSDISSASAPIASMTATDSKELLGNTLTKSIATAVWRTPSCVPCRDSELLISAGDSGLSRKMTRPLTCRYSIAWKRLPGGLGGAGGFACHFRIRKRPGRRNRLPHQKDETFWKLTPKRLSLGQPLFHEIRSSETRFDTRSGTVASVGTSADAARKRACATSKWDGYLLTSP